MAVLCASADGNLTAAGTWSVIDSSSFREGTNTGAADATWRGATTTAFTPGAITIDAILVKPCFWGSATRGTISVRLYNVTDAVAVTGTTVSIGGTDVFLVQNDVTEAAGWTLFKFSAPVTLIAAKAYNVQVSVSAGSLYMYNASTTSSDWSRCVRVSGAAAAAPTTGDSLIITGEWTAAATKTDRTVTMDQTSSATIYGSAGTTYSSITIGKGGTLAFGTAAATNYFFNVQGILFVGYEGVLSIGTVANPIPRDSTATMQFNVTGTAASYYGHIRGTFTAQGLSRTSGKNVVFCKLNTDEAIGQTVLGVDTDTGWLNNDEIIIAQTSRSSSPLQGERRNLSGNATATELTVSSGLTYAHEGTASNKWQAEIILMTRNVVIKAPTDGKPSGIKCGARATIDCDWVQFYNMGGDTSNASGLGVNALDTFHVDYCSFDGRNYSGAPGMAISTNPTPLTANGWTLTLTYNVATGVPGGLLYVRDGDCRGSVVLEDCWAIGCAGTSGGNGMIGYFAGCINMPVTLTRCYSVSGANGAYCVHVAPGSGNTQVNTYEYNPGFRLITATDCMFRETTYYANMVNVMGAYFKNCTFGHSWNRGSIGGIYNQSIGSWDWVFEDCTFWGGNTVLYLAYETFGTPNKPIKFINCKFGNKATTGPTDYMSCVFHDLRQPQSAYIEYHNCLFGTVAGSKFTAFPASGSAGYIVHATAAYSNADFVITMNSCNKDSGLAYENGNGAATDLYKWRFQHEGQVAGTNRVYQPRIGTVARDATVYRTSGASEKLTPINRASTWTPLRSAVRRVDVASGAQPTVSVYVKTDASYNGIAPRLVMRGNPSIGQNVDVVLDSHSGVSGSWEQVTGQIPVAATNDGQFEVVVEVSGTAGNVWVDDWSV